ncbi:murein hydrolase activator EnvC family protein [Campylobacter corcagiensis]|uniref:Peptidoglycan DD-metalloendopeptidase family protein n=1 Tax=Campylobacter corcagiensis TaxID=1448857 RepID=A0A7M1LG24_9BACT|nr:peptidoglycan DD-metalloendopeptidase family protein [Campylobacter corcagiensis]QKF64434.1 zinc metallopeptidase, M23 family [Campylobacter corcagiensis]QOQ87380.1 peptidoglycan DD-metalloendopeptidase family protein [Campylobacter corcagiensis]
MRVLSVFVLIVSLLFSAPTTKDKIDDTNKALAKSKKDEVNLNKKIDDLGKQILKQNKELEKTKTKIDEISGLVINLSEKHKEEEIRLNKLKEQNATLISSKLSLEEQLVDLIANDFSLNLVQDSDIKSSQSLISNEIFKSLNSVVNDEFKELLKDYEKTLKNISDKNSEISAIENSLKDYNAKKDELSKTQKKKESLVANLAKDKEDYISRLEKATNTSSALSKTLAELKIIDDKEERQKALKAQEKAKKAREKAATSSKKDEEPPVVVSRDRRVDDIDKKVKLYGSSYQESRVKKYKGPKTISPIKGAVLKRNFGNYIDPVYGIKIFNESIILGSKTPNAQVQNVLDGKVIFAKSTPILNNVIIVENADGIHTIYAHLSQIAPTIKVGSRIKKGYVIGRISDELTFEVTQKNFHINPLDLISL